MSGSRARRGFSILAGVVLAVAGLVWVGPSASASVKNGDLITAGTPFSVDLLPPPGTGVSVRLNASAGQRLVVREGSPHSVLLTATNAAGTVVSGSLDTYSEVGILPTTGTWTLSLQLIESAPATVSLTVDLPTDVTKALTLGAATSATTTVGQNTVYTFHGTTGQKLDVNVAKVNLAALTVRLLRPDGTPIDYLTHGGDGPFESIFDLDQTGTWTLVIDPSGAAAGSVTFTARVPVDTVVPVTSGQSVKVTYPGGGTRVRLTFTAAVGQHVTLSVPTSALSSSDPGTAPSVQARLIGPDGVSRGDIGQPMVGPAFLNDTHTVDKAGTWTVVLDPAAATTGTQTVKLSALADVSFGTFAVGTTRAVAYSVPGQRFTYTVAGTAGKRLLFELSALKVTAGGSGGDASQAWIGAVLYGPDGAVVSSYFGLNDTFGELYEPVTGTYKLVLTGFGDTVGTANLTVRNPSVATAALPLGTSTTVTIGQGNQARYTFTGVAGSRLSFLFTKQVVNVDPYFGTSRVLVYRPDGTLFSSAPFSAYADIGEYFTEAPPLPSAGAWSAVIDPDANVSGSFTFTPRLTADQKLSLTPGTKLTTRISLPGQQARYTFPGVKGRRITLDSTAIAWTNSTDGRQTQPVDFFLVRPDGSVVTDAFWPVPPYNSAGATFQELDRLGGVLDATGTWTLVVDPFQEVVGSQTFTLGQVTDLSGSATRGTAKKVTLGTRGQQGRYTFSWNGRGSLPWSVTAAAFAGTLSIVSPDGSWVQSGSFAKGSTTGRSFPGDSENGTWTAVVDAAGIGTGAVTFKVG